MLSPIHFTDSSTPLSIYSASLIPLTKAISSAKSISVIIMSSTLLLCLFLSWKPSFSFLPVRAFLMIYSIIMTMRYGTSVSPCKTPARILKVSVPLSDVMTFADVYSYIILIAVTNYSGIPYTFSISSIFLYTLYQKLS